MSRIVQIGESSFIDLDSIVMVNEFKPTAPGERAIHKPGMLAVQLKTGKRYLCNPTSAAILKQYLQHSDIVALGPQLDVRVSEIIELLTRSDMSLATQRNRETGIKLPEAHAARLRQALRDSPEANDLYARSIRPESKERTRTIDLETNSARPEEIQDYFPD